jgi:hypothetical protein
MRLLDGALAETFAAVFGGVYSDGLLYRPNDFADDGKGGGDGQGFDDPQPVKVQVDQATQSMRQAEGFVEGDVRILMLAHGVAGVTSDCEIEARGTRYMIEFVGTDPAGSYWEVRGRKA